MLFPAHSPTRPQTFFVRSGSKRVPWCAAALTVIMIATATAVEERETCQKAEGQAAVAACTAVISSGQLQGHDLAAAHFSRAFNLNKLGEPDRAIEIRAAAAARVLGRLVHRDPGAGCAQTDRGGKSRETCADDVDVPRHQTIAYRNAIQMRRARPRRMRGRGADQPCATMPSRMPR